MTFRFNNNNNNNNDQTKFVDLGQILVQFVIASGRIFPGIGTGLNQI